MHDPANSSAIEWPKFEGGTYGSQECLQTAGSGTRLIRICVSWQHLSVPHGASIPISENHQLDLVCRIQSFEIGVVTLF